MNARHVRLTVLGCLLALPLSGCGLSFQTLPKVKPAVGPHYTLNATFKEVLNLPSDAQVRLGPQVVGEVSSIGTSDFKAQVGLAIKNDIKLPVGTTAQVRFDNPLGDQYVLLTVPPHPSGDMLVNGARLGLPATSSAASVEDAFGALSAVLNGGGIDQLQTIVTELNANFAGNQQQIHDLFGQINTAVTSLAQGRTVVVNALQSLNGLSQQLNAGSGTLTAGIDALAPAVGELASQNGDIANLLHNFSDLSAVGNRIVMESGQDSISGAKSLLPVLQQLVDVKERLGNDLTTIAEFQRVTATKAPGDYLQLGVTVNIDFPAGPQTAEKVSSAAAGTDNPVRALLQAGLS